MNEQTKKIRVELITSSFLLLKNIATMQAFKMWMTNENIIRMNRTDKFFSTRQTMTNKLARIYMQRNKIPSQTVHGGPMGSGNANSFMS